MINFNKSNINILSFFISLVIYSVIVLIINYPKLEKNIQKQDENNSFILSEEENKFNNLDEVEIKKWYIQIDSLQIKANIKQMKGNIPEKNYVGHFEQTDIIGNNIALIGFNFGTEKNYFANLKKLKEGSLIKYKNNNFQKTYVVTKHIIIKDTDWTVFEKQEKNTITLITCVENEPEDRRCIQAVEQN